MPVFVSGDNLTFFVRLLLIIEHDCRDCRRDIHFPLYSHTQASALYGPYSRMF
jgi:hypothetical protein